MAVSNSTAGLALVAGMGLAAGIGAACFAVGTVWGQKKGEASDATGQAASSSWARTESDPTRLPRVSDVHDAVFISNDVINTRIEDLRQVISPAVLLEDLSDAAAVETVRTARDQVSRIINGKDDRLLVVVGPCSIHDPKAAMEYAGRLVQFAKEVEKDLMVVMRVYFEKPRTTVGWKGLINDPDLDGSHNINKGIRIARRLLLEINALGLPTGCEFLDTISPQFLADLVSWGAIGARTTESQVHRELASGLSMPIGFKNGTSGDIKIACDAITSSSFAHSFLSVTHQGTVAIVSTTGNKDCHLILRGGADKTNFDQESVARCVALLQKAKVTANVVIDCSHGNSQKLHANQPKVAADVAGQIARGSHHVVGVMIESNLVEGAQPLTDGKALVYGQSITDACIDWNTTTTVLHGLAASVQARRALRA